VLIAEGLFAAGRSTKVRGAPKTGRFAEASATGRPSRLFILRLNKVEELLENAERVPSKWKLQRKRRQSN
jgi:hypothetical protein